MAAFADVLRTLRRQRDMTQKEAAQALNISASAWGMYESGKREPDIETLHMLADYFGVSLDQLTGKEPASKQIEPAKPFNLEERLAEIETKLRAAGYSERSIRTIMEVARMAGRESD
jgi:transcriptional regulator with XRE-family HTH domain